MANPLHVPEKISTARLILRRAQVSDAESIFHEYTQDPQVTLYMTWRPNKDVQETRTFLAGCVERWNDGSEYTRAITLKGDDHAVGMIAVRPRGHAAEIGYVLARRLWNTGLMTEAVAAIINWLEQQPGIYRIWASHDIGNPASGRVMEKAGLFREGIFRRWVIHPNISAEPRDCCVYSKIRA